MAPTGKGCPAASTRGGWAPALLPKVHNAHDKSAIRPVIAYSIQTDVKLKGVLLHVCGRLNSAKSLCIPRAAGYIKVTH
jgi:hypothetical protein